MTALTSSQVVAARALEQALIESAWATALLRRAVDLTRLGTDPLEAVVAAAMDGPPRNRGASRSASRTGVVAEDGWVVIAALRATWSDDAGAVRWLVSGDVPKDGDEDARAPLLALAAGDVGGVRRALAGVRADVRADVRARGTPAVGAGDAT